VAVVFTLTAMAWVFRENKDLGALTLPGLEAPFPTDSDSTLAKEGAVALLPKPAHRKRWVLPHQWQADLLVPWGVLLLFGGGLSLARGMDVSGVADWIGTGVGALSVLPTVVVLGIISAIIVFQGEMTSNTATATMAMPIMAGVGMGLG